MNNDELKIELEVLKRQKVDLEKKIEELQEQINATTEMLNTVLMSVSQ